MLARLMPGVLLLIVFIPVHIMLWDKFPAWITLCGMRFITPHVSDE